jgi:phospholipid/cholesterol/gamma-HCH transport system substrate-binding protein
MTAPGQVQLPVNTPRTPPYKLAGLVLLVITAVIVALVWGQFRGTFAEPEKLTMLSARSGLSMDPGSKVTYNGVEIGHVATVEAVDVGGVPKARVMLDVDKKFVHLIPQNVDAEIKATTVFGNKYVAFSSPKDPSAARIKSADVIDVSTVTTEHAVRDRGVGGGEGRPRQAQPDAHRDRAGARRIG